MDRNQKQKLQLLANKIRKYVLKSIFEAGSGHPGGCLSAVDYLTYLYDCEMQIDPLDPLNINRDRFILSKGHAAPALYAILAVKGYFPVDDLKMLRKFDSYLQGHPNMNTTPGVDMTTGSLGQGISAAAGMAKGAKILAKDVNIYTLLGDGELNEGQVWEAILFAAHYKLDNLCIAVDVNGFQIDGSTKDILNTEPLKDKFMAFGCSVISIDGHNFEEINQAFDFFRSNSSKPTVILLKTVKGKGVSFMENSVEWHGKAPTQKELESGIQELE